MLPQLALCLLPAVAVVFSGPAHPTLRSYTSHLLIWCPLLWLSGCIAYCENVLMLRKLHYSNSISCGLWLEKKKEKTINLNKFLLHNGIFVRSSIVLHHGQRRLWKYPVYLASWYLECFCDSWKKWEGWELAGLKDLISLSLRAHCLRALRETHRLIPGSARSLGRLDLWDTLS